MLVAFINFSKMPLKEFQACKNIHRELTSWKSFFWQKIVGATK